MLYHIRFDIFYSSKYVNDDMDWAFMNIDTYEFEWSRTKVGDVRYYYWDNLNGEYKCE